MPLDTSALVLSLSKETPLSRAHVVVFAKRVLRLVSRHLALLHSAWEEIKLLQEASSHFTTGEGGHYHRTPGADFSCRMSPSPPHFGAMIVEIECRIGGGEEMRRGLRMRGCGNAAGMQRGVMRESV